MEERVRVEIDNGVAQVRLNRPDKRNGLDLAMFEALVAAGARLRDDRTVRCVVLSGEGPAFCAGLDVKSFFASGPAAAERLLERGPASPANLAQRAAWIWQEVSVPVIAAVHGAAFGGGLQIALGADLRYVAPDAQLSVMEARYGLIPDMGASRTLLSVVREDVAKELTWTARVVSGVEAVALGLATRVSSEPLRDALATAREMAVNASPHALRAAKRLYTEAPRLPLREAFVLESELQRALLNTPNQLEAVQATLARRAPAFENPE